MILPLPIAISLLMVGLLGLLGFRIINLLFPDWFPEKNSHREKS